MTETTWTRHPKHVGYEASSDGRVRSIGRLVPNRWGSTHWRSGRELRTFTRKGGYLGGNLSVEGTRLNFEVHRFVCEAFHGIPTDPTQMVRHLNGDRLDNRPENLAWGTASENNMDRVRHGTHHEAAMTHCSAGHAFDSANTYRSPGSPRKRRCRTCDKQREARRQRRR